MNDLLWVALVVMIVMLLASVQPASTAASRMDPITALGHS